MPIVSPPLAWSALSPLLVVTAASFACLLLDIVPGARKTHLVGVGVLGLAGAALASALMWGRPAVAFQQMVVADDFALFFNGIFVLTTGLVLLLSVGYARRQHIEAGEYYVLILFAAVGMMLMASAVDLLVVFLGLELMSLSLYVLAGFFRTRPTGNESSMKYFLLGAFSSGFFLYGIALLYGATGTTNLARLGAALGGPGAGRDPLVLVGVALLLVGFGFKTSAVPFHQWAPDVYEGAPTSITALIATGSKAAVFAALLRLAAAALRQQPDWTPLLWGLAGLTMTVGNVVAIAQSSVKRMLAYSSVAHVGYLLVGVVAGGPAGAAAVLFYLLAYTFTTVGTFGMLTLLERAGEDAVDVRDFAGLGRRHPVLALVLALFLLSLIGVPPLAGFVGKFYLFGAAVQAGYLGLAVLGVLNSAVAAYYYLRVIVYMYMREPEGSAAGVRPSFAGGLALTIALAGIVLLGVVPAPFVDLAQAAVAPLVR